MAEQQTTIEGVRERLTALLADWGAELAIVLKELEEKRARVDELEDSAASRSDELSVLQKRLEAQEERIESLKLDSEEAARLGNEIRAKDLQFERVSSELNSKKELIGALRRVAEGTDQLKADSRLKDREIEVLRGQVQDAEQRIEGLNKELSLVREAAASQASADSKELEVVRAELEARKTLIKSLRADQERLSTLQSSLTEKREIIEELGSSIDRNATTLMELRQSAETWQRKYEAMKAESSTAVTSVSVPLLSDTDVRTLEHLEKIVPKKDMTVAIDMRRSLLEARRAAAGGGGEK